MNLIGDHVDYTGGLVLPMTLDRRTTIVGHHVDEKFWQLSSLDDPRPLALSLPIIDPSSVEPAWGRYVAGVLHGLNEAGVDVRGFVGEISTSLPIGAGLSSSAALEIAVARTALDGSTSEMDNIEIALLCQRAEQIASGVPCGIMDQLSIAAGRANTATLIDCRSLAVEYLAIPDDLEIVERFISHRTLVGSEYADRVADCRVIESIIGSLREASLDDIEQLSNERLRKRARHVISENQRVRRFVTAIAGGEYGEAGQLMLESHRSLAEDYETSNATMDRAVAELMNEPGILGARMTGGGFGGCIVALRRRDQTSTK